MKYGYARVSTRGQEREGNSLTVQEDSLKRAGAEIIYSDTFTGTKTHRPQLDALLSKIAPGDTLIVTKLDRIARSASQGMDLIQSLLDKDINVHVLNMGLMDNTPTGKLVRSVFLAFAEFERDMIVERTQEGKAIAKTKEGFREGRPPKYTRAQIEHALSLLGENSIPRVVEMTGISKSTILRAKKQETGKC